MIWFNFPQPRSIRREAEVLDGLAARRSPPAACRSAFTDPSVQKNQLRGRDHRAASEDQPLLIVDGREACTCSSIARLVILQSSNPLAPSQSSPFPSVCLAADTLLLSALLSLYRLPCCSMSCCSSRPGGACSACHMLVRMSYSERSCLRNPGLEIRRHF